MGGLVVVVGGGARGGIVGEGCHVVIGFVILLLGHAQDAALKSGMADAAPRGEGVHRRGEGSVHLSFCRDAERVAFAWQGGQRREEEGGEAAAASSVDGHGGASLLEASMPI